MASKLESHPSLLLDDTRMKLPRVESDCLRDVTLDELRTLVEGVSDLSLLLLLLLTEPLVESEVAETESSWPKDVFDDISIFFRYSHHSPSRTTPVPSGSIALNVDAAGRWESGSAVLAKPLNP